ncbi:hypothetical protein BSR29_07210 [Boudabousia liubingyangii]|uniref:SGNH hydrolase-type esterase domain-containing protein n=1 Tax=Boudabousia liubingyangii TaxID=1921764 RepID=A0A1Q5PK52_9ACTO|nr:SGNH/GDSL hydrolase family protein [Boudabousia liubingyangii]OKL46604.1 hypothetical protein BSR29_07210 [Boudabousia liubingyangii]
MTQPQIVFYGDSIVSGYLRGGSPDTRFSSILANLLGAQELNYAIDGLGYLAQPPVGPDTIELIKENMLKQAPKADLLMVCLGVNDVPLMRDYAPQVFAAVHEQLTQIAEARNGQPTLISMYYPGTQLGERSLALVDYLEQQCQELGLTFTRALIGATGGLPQFHHNDRIHPNPAGHALLAQAALAAVRELHVPALQGTTEDR